MIEMRDETGSVKKSQRISCSARADSPRYREHKLVRQKESRSLARDLKFSAQSQLHREEHPQNNRYGQTQALHNGPS